MVTVTFFLKPKMKRFIFLDDKLKRFIFCGVASYVNVANPRRGR